jgi:drug/metabolite transporter (DMT)-like permease
MKYKPLPFVFLAMFLVGLLNLFSKDLLGSGLSPIEICACREGVTAVVFIVLMLIWDRSAFKVPLRDIWLFILFAVFNTVSNLCAFTAQDYLPLEVAAVLEMTFPYFILVFAFFLFGDVITRRKVLAAVLAFIGCVFIIGIVNGVEDLDVFGVAVGLLSGITLAAFTLGGKYVGERGYSANTATLYFFTFSALLIAPLTNWGNVYASASSDHIILLCILLMGVLCTLVPNYIVIKSVRVVDPALISIIITASVIVSTIFGVVVFGDPFGITDVIGIILIMIAITILDPPKALLERFGKEKTEE